MFFGFLVFNYFNMANSGLGMVSKVCLAFLELSKIDQIWILGPLIYYQSISKNQERSLVYFKNRLVL